MPAFRQLAQQQRTEEAHRELYEQVVAEGRRARKQKAAGAEKLLERRLIELVRTPRAVRDPGWCLWEGHDAAWSDLVDMRSQGFARLLSEWVSGRDRNLASWAAGHLGRMERGQNRLREAAREGHTEVAMGLAWALEERHAAKTFAAPLLRDLTPYVTGERRLKGGDKYAREMAWGSILHAIYAAGREQAIAMLASEAIRPQNPALREVLHQMTADAREDPAPYRKLLDAKPIWVTYEALRKRTKKPDEYGMILGMLLMLAACVEPARAQEEAEALRPEARKSEMLREYIKDAQRISRDIPDPEALLTRLYAGKLKLKPQAMAVVEAWSMHRYVLGDGLEGYLSDMGHSWQKAHKGLKILGKEQAADKLAAAAKYAFGGKRITTPEAARRATDALLDDWESFEKVCERYWKVSQDVPEAVKRCIAQRPGEFR